MSLASTLKTRRVDFVRSIEQILPLVRASLEINNNNTSSKNHFLPQNIALAYREAYLLCNSKVIDLSTNNNNFTRQQQQQQLSSTDGDDETKSPHQNPSFDYYFPPEFLQRAFPAGVPLSSSSAPGALLLQHIVGSELAEYFISSFGEKFNACLTSHQQRLTQLQNQNNNQQQQQQHQLQEQQKNEIIMKACFNLLELYNSHFERLLGISLPLLEAFLPPSGWYTVEQSLVTTSSSTTASSIPGFPNNNNNNNLTSNNNNVPVVSVPPPQPQPYHHQLNNNQQENNRNTPSSSSSGLLNNINNNNNNNTTAGGTGTHFSTNINSHNVRHLFHATSVYGAAIHQPVSLREVIFRHWCDFALTPHVGSLMNAAATLLFLLKNNSKKNVHDDDDDDDVQEMMNNTITRFGANLREIAGCEIRTSSPNTHSMFFMSAVTGALPKTSLDTTFNQSKSKIITSLSVNLTINTNNTPAPATNNNNVNNNNNNNKEKTFFESFKQIMHEVFHQKALAWVLDWCSRFQNNNNNNQSTPNTFSNNNNTELFSLIHELVCEVNDWSLRRHFTAIRDKAKLIEFRRELIIFLEKHCANLISPLYSNALLSAIATSAKSNNSQNTNDDSPLHQQVKNDSNNNHVLLQDLFELSLLSTQLMRHLHVNLTNVAHVAASKILGETIQKSFFTEINNNSNNSFLLEILLKIGVFFVKNFAKRIVELEYLCSSSIPSDGSSLLAIDCGFANAMLAMNFILPESSSSSSPPLRKVSPIFRDGKVVTDDAVSQNMKNNNPLLQDEENNTNNMMTTAAADGGDDDDEENRNENIRARNRHFVVSLLAFVASQVCTNNNNNNNNIAARSVIDEKRKPSHRKSLLEELASAFEIIPNAARQNDQDHSSSSSSSNFKLACKAIALVYRYLPDKDIFAMEFYSTLSLQSCSGDGDGDGDGDGINNNEIFENDKESSTSSTFMNKNKILLESIFDADPFASRDLKHRFDQIEQARKVGEKVQEYYQRDIQENSNSAKKDDSDCVAADDATEINFTSFLPRHIASNFPQTFSQFWSRTKHQLLLPNQQQQHQENQTMPWSLSIPRQILSNQNLIASLSTKNSPLLLHPKWKLDWNYGVTKCELKGTYFSTASNGKNEEVEARIVCTGLQAMLLIDLASSQNNIDNTYNSENRNKIIFSKPVKTSSGVYRYDLKPLEEAGLIQLVFVVDRKINNKNKNHHHHHHQSISEIRLNNDSSKLCNNNKSHIVVDTYTPTFQVYEGQNLLALSMLSAATDQNGQSKNYSYSYKRRNNSSGNHNEDESDDTTENEDDDDDDDAENKSNNKKLMPASSLTQLHPGLVQSRNLALQAAIVQIFKRQPKPQKQTHHNNNNNNSHQQEGLSFKELSEIVFSFTTNSKTNNNNGAATNNNNNGSDITSLGFTPSLIDIRTQLETLIGKSYVRKIMNNMPGQEVVVRYAFEI